MTQHSIPGRIKLLDGSIGGDDISGLVNKLHKHAPTIDKGQLESELTSATPLSMQTVRAISSILGLKNPETHKWLHGFLTEDEVECSASENVELVVKLMGQLHTWRKATGDQPD